MGRWARLKRDTSSCSFLFLNFLFDSYYFFPNHDVKRTPYLLCEFFLENFVLMLVFVQPDKDVKLNKTAKVKTTCLLNGQRPLSLLTSFWPKILDNWQFWHQKSQVEGCKGGNKLLLPGKFGRHLMRNKYAHGPVSNRRKSDPGRVSSTVLVTISWVWPPSLLIEFHSIDKTILKINYTYMKICS